MKQTDITLNEQYRIDAEGLLAIPYKLRNQILTGTIIEKGVEYNHDRKDGVVVRFDDVEGIDKPVTVPARKVTMSVKEHEANIAAAIEAEKEREARRVARDQALADQIDTSVLAHAIKQMMYRPADAAVDLIRNLDTLIEYATEIRDEIKDGITEDGSAWNARPKRDEDGREMLPALPHNFRHMVARMGDVSQAAAKYEHDRSLFNALSVSGVDFEKSLDIEHDR